MPQRSRLGLLWLLTDPLDLPPQRLLHLCCGGRLEGLHDRLLRGVALLVGGVVDGQTTHCLRFERRRLANCGGEKGSDCERRAGSNAQKQRNAVRNTGSENACPHVMQLY